MCNNTCLHVLNTKTDEFAALELCMCSAWLLFYAYSFRVNSVFHAVFTVNTMSTTTVIYLWVILFDDHIESSDYSVLSCWQVGR